MIRIGLTGSIAMGKSEVAKVFASEGLPIFDADKEVHHLYDSSRGAELLQPLIPNAIVKGRVDRPKLAAHIQDFPELLSKLEEIVHEDVARRRESFAKNMQLNGHSMIVFDIPLLFEKGNEKHVDVTVVVSAPPEQQHARALARPGMTEERLKLILTRQMPDAEKRKRADYVIENNADLATLRTRTLKVLDAIKKAHHQ